MAVFFLKRFDTPINGGFATEQIDASGPKDLLSEMIKSSPGGNKGRVNGG
jgi:hypothetical protein